MGLVVSPDAGKRRGIEWKAAAERGRMSLAAGGWSDRERGGVARCGGSRRQEAAVGRRRRGEGATREGREVSLDARGWGDRRGGGVAGCGAMRRQDRGGVAGCGAMGRQERGMGRQARARCRSAGRKGRPSGRRDRVDTGPGGRGMLRPQARSSVVEHYLDTVGVAGSTPVAPTRITQDFGTGPALLPRIVAG